MKYTPLDIQRREFEKAFRGIDEGEVRSFLHEIAAEWGEILSLNRRLKEEILDLRERNRQFQEQERIFRETLLQAQRTKEDVDFSETVQKAEVAAAGVALRRVADEVAAYMGKAEER